MSLIGFIVSLASFGYGSSVFIGYFFAEREVPGFAALATLTSFLLGLVIVMLGVLGEYIWRIADDTSQRPEAVIDEVHGSSSQ
jgi:dolichol-phosphate mannosyltransferase